jgi:hypothetical protein
VPGGIAAGHISRSGVDALDVRPRAARGLSPTLPTRLLLSPWERGASTAVTSAPTTAMPAAGADEGVIGVGQGADVGELVRPVRLRAEEIAVPATTGVLKPKRSTIRGATTTAKPERSDAADALSNVVSKTARSSLAR